MQPTRAHAAVIWRGTWPTMVVLHFTATAKGGVLSVFCFTRACQFFPKRRISNILVDVMASNTAFKSKSFHFFTVVATVNFV